MTDLAGWRVSALGRVLNSFRSIFIPARRVGQSVEQNGLNNFPQEVSISGQQAGSRSTSRGA